MQDLMQDENLSIIFYWPLYRRQKSTMISFPLLTQLDRLSLSLLYVCWDCLHPFRILLHFISNSTLSLPFRPSFHHVVICIVLHHRRIGSVKEFIYFCLCRYVHRPVRMWSYSNFKSVLLLRTWNCILRSMQTDQRTQRSGFRPSLVIHTKNKI